MPSPEIKIIFKQHDADHQSRQFTFKDQELLNLDIYPLERKFSASWKSQLTSAEVFELYRQSHARLYQQIIKVDPEKELAVEFSNESLIKALVYYSPVSYDLPDLEEVRKEVALFKGFGLYTRLISYSLTQDDPEPELNQLRVASRYNLAREVVLLQKASGLVRLSDDKSDQLAFLINNLLSSLQTS